MLRKQNNLAVGQMKCWILILSIAVAHLAVVGCDGVVGSKRRLNSCGLCGDDDRQCHRIEGLFVRPMLSPGSNVMVTLPMGACNVTVKQLKPSSNLLAVRLRDGSMWYAGASSHLDIAGSRFTHLMATIEEGDSIIAPGPIHEPVDLMLIYHEPNRGIKYEYFVASTDDENETETETPFTSTHLGKDATKSEGLAKDDDDDIDLQDDDARENKVAGSRSDVSFPFGADVQGTESHDPHRATAAAYRETPSPHPRKRHYVWVAAPGTCSRPCGGGIQTQVLKCVREVDRLEVKEQLCYGVERPPLRSVKCNTRPCQANIPDSNDPKVISSHGRHHVHYHHPSLDWTTGPWSQCIGGIRRRTVLCRHSADAIYANTLSNSTVDCSLEYRPVSEETCIESRDLQRDHTLWFTSEWSSQCSSECGTGEQTRHVVCLARGGLCDEADRPASTRSCTSNQRCAPRWFAGAWGPCSANCGPGVQRRHIACLSWSSSDGLPTPSLLTACSNATRPDSQRPCSERLCPPTWLTSEWGQCSRSCGNGYQKREARCSSEAHDANSIFTSLTGSTTANGCLRHSRPLLRRLCNTHACPDTPQNVIAAVASTSSVSFGGRRSIPSKSSLDSESHDIANSQKDSADGNSPGEVCQDTLRHCLLAVQARLCKYPYYVRGCCASCRRHAAASDRTLA